jgi:hypothetical protein
MNLSSTTSKRIGSTDKFPAAKNLITLKPAGEPRAGPSRGGKRVQDEQWTISKSHMLGDLEVCQSLEKSIAKAAKKYHKEDWRQFYQKGSWPLCWERQECVLDCCYTSWRDECLFVTR